MKFKHQGFFYKCAYEGCKWEGRSTGSRDRHVATIHKFRMEICHVCGKSVNSGHMKKHLLNHSELKFPCSFCDKKFTHAFKKINHEMIHKQPRELICKYCGDRFNMRQNLARHIFNRHQNAKFNCRVPGCASVLRTRDNYRCHLKTVHRSLPNEELQEFIKKTMSMKPDYVEELEDPWNSWK